MPSVLIIDDEPNIRRMVGALLEAEGFEVRDASDGQSGIARSLEWEPDLVLLDLMMPGALDGIATLEQLRERFPELPVVMMSGRAGLADAVKATRLGAVNFLEKPLTPEGVLLALGSALELRMARRERSALRADLGLAGELVGDSPALRVVREMIARVAPTDARVLITGESGTGKEIVAAAIHAESARKEKPFVRVNCAAIPRDLVESEMFGHERGSFTGATERRIGRFELAHTGTLFLDEVGDLGPEARGDLLLGGRRVLHDVVEDRGDQGLRVEPQVGEQVGHGHRVGDVGLAGAAALAVMGLEGEVVRLLHPLDLLRGQVGLELGDQLGDAYGPSSVGQQAAQGRRDVHRRAASGLVSQPDLRCAELAHEFGLGHEFRRRRRGRIRLLEDLDADVARGDFTQRKHGRLVVLPVERRLGTVRQFAGAPGGDQHQLEQVGDVLHAVFDGDTGHECASVGRAGTRVASIT